MTRKRRMFEIEMPDEPLADAPPAPPAKDEAARRGPMASAISENAEALQARKGAQDAIRQENDALAHEYVALKNQGQVVLPVALDQVHSYLLVRDRIPGEDAELADLVRSIRDVGLSNPIRVIPRPNGDGYELVQGFRRLTAYRQLLDETGDDTWGQIPALIMPGEPDVAGLYRRMVDENVVRKDLSFAEMAHAAEAYAADPETEVSDLTTAVAELFQSAAYSKRSYIRSFATLLSLLGPDLKYPTEIPRALGVSLARSLKQEPAIAARIRKELDGWDNRGVEDELGILRRYTDVDVVADDAAKPASRGAGQGGKTKTTFLIRSRAGQVKCTASDGRLEIKVAQDFSAIDRKRLEDAISSLIDGLG